MKKNILIYVLGFAFILGCSKQPTSSTKQYNIDVKLEFAQKQKPTSLQKTNRVVSGGFKLNFDEPGDIAKDSTPNGNDAKMTRVTRSQNRGGLAANFSSRDSSIAVVRHQSSLNGAHILDISAQIFPTDTERYTDQIILDKRDHQKYFGNTGFCMGIEEGYFFFEYTDAWAYYERVYSYRKLEANQWYNVQIKLENDSLMVMVNNEVDSYRNLYSYIMPSDSDILIGAGRRIITLDVERTTYHFDGLIDNLEYFAQTEYVDVDEIRIASIDVTKITKLDSLPHYYLEPEYIAEFGYVLDEFTVPYNYYHMEWADIMKYWKTHFNITNEFSIRPKGETMDVNIKGVDGLNMVAVAMYYQGKITHYGNGYVYLSPRFESAPLSIMLYEIDEYYYDDYNYNDGN